MKKLIGFVVVLLVAGGGWWYYITYGRPVEQPQVVQTAISRGDITEAVSATGTLEPLRRVDVGSQVSGVVKELYVDFNSIVKQGQLLAEIDPALLDVQVQIQTANIERQKGDIENQKVQLEDQKRQRDRTQSLYDKGLQNQQQLEAALLSVKTREAQIASAEKSLVQAEANLNQAKLNLGYTKIYSPIDGVVVDRRVDKGQTVQASMNTPSFFILATPLQNMKLTAGVDESEIGKIRPGMEVRFSVDAYGTQTFYGSVNAVRLNATNQNNVITYPVWIDVPNPDLKLRPSMTANIKIVISTATNVVRVPNQALRFRPNTEIYTALGLPPPQAGQGRAAGAGTQGGNGRGGEQPAPGAGTAGAPGGSRQAQPGQTQRGQTSPRGETGPAPGQGGQQTAMRQGGERPQSGQPGQQMGQVPGGENTGRGGRGGGDMSNLTPEQRQQLMERFARGGTGGRGGQSGGRTGNQAFGQGGQGQSGGRGGRNTQQAAPPPPVTGEDPKIDDYFAPIQRTESRSSVWTWDAEKKELKQINLRLGVTDGTFSELLSGDVQVGQQVVTGVILPQAARTTTQQNPLFQQPGRGGMPGGMGGFGGPGGGGGGRGGGGRN